MDYASIKQVKTQDKVVPVLGGMTATIKLGGGEEVIFDTTNINVYKGAYYCVSARFDSSGGEHLVDICVLSDLEDGDHKIGAQEQKVVAAYTGETVHGVASSGVLTKFKWKAGESMSGDFAFECVDAGGRTIYTLSNGTFKVSEIPTS